MKRLVFLLLFAPFPALAGPGNYLDTVPVFWRTLYPDGGQGLYCGAEFAPHNRLYNIEHVYPMAWVTRALGCGKRDACRRNSQRFNDIESDMHNLYPVRKDINRARGAYPYREIRGERRFEPDCDLKIDHRARVVEPPPASRGNIARAMLYMEDRYGLTLYERQRRLLLEWHRSDPADAHERWRNHRIAEVQGESNPWIE